MSRSIVLNTKIDWLLIRVLCCTIIFYYFKTAFWPLTYLFVSGYALLILLFLLRFDWKFRLSGFFKSYLPPTLLIGLLVAVVLVNKQYLNPSVLKDLSLVGILLSFFYFLYWITEVRKLEIPLTFAIYTAISTMLFICTLNLINVLWPLHIAPELLSKVHINEGNTLATDYNFYCLFIIICLLIFNYCREFIPKNFPGYLFTYLAGFIFIINIILSGSRRGLVVFLLLFISYLIAGIAGGKYKINAPRVLKPLIISIVLIVLSGILIVKIFPREKISEIVYRYSSIVGKSNYEEINRRLWAPGLSLSMGIDSMLKIQTYKSDPRDWKTSDGGIILRPVVTPYGNGIKINTGANAANSRIYCKMPALIYLANHTYNISFKAKLNLLSKNSLRLSWWSDDGNYHRLYTDLADKKIDSIGNGWYDVKYTYTFIDNHIGIVLFLSHFQSDPEQIISDFRITDLDFDNSLYNSQSKVNTESKVIDLLDQINPPLNSSLNLINNGDFKYGTKFWYYSASALSVKTESSDSMKYLDITRGNGDNGYFSLYYSGRNIEFKADNEYQLAFKMKSISPKIIPFQVGYWLNEGDGFQNNLNLKVDTLQFGWLSIKANYTFKSNQNGLIFPINSQISNSQFYITQISLVNLTNKQYQSTKYTHGNHKLNEKSDQLISTEDELNQSAYSGRTVRWEFAADLWKTDYKWYNKIFGRGFDYYELFVKKFKTKSTIDYPHNPFVSILLYSGILGLAAYLWLLYKTISLYLIYYKKYRILFICFLMTFVFSFLSGSSPFDPPVMGFFVFLPFYIHQINKNKELSSLKK